MADDVDLANDQIQNAVSRALENMRQNSAQKIGAKNCAECEEAIPEARRQLGYRLCVDCATQSERRRSLFSNE